MLITPIPQIQDWNYFFYLKMAANRSKNPPNQSEKNTEAKDIFKNEGLSTMRGRGIIRVICCVITVTHHPPRPPVPPPQNIQHQYGKIKTLTTTSSKYSTNPENQDWKIKKQQQTNTKYMSTLSNAVPTISSSTPS